ncbi:hypothetical protein HZB94_03245 [Candidatus Falkowbacteria bacterium]|nr:hypothetical protein [Candidatus Falkowbacteria bacterium]
MKRGPKTVLVQYGEVSVREKKFVGMTTGAIKEAVKVKLGLPDEVVAEVNDEPFKMGDKLQAGETLLFELPTVKVTCGVNEVREAKYIGKSVAYVRKAAKDVLNIPKDADAVLNGDTVDRKCEKDNKLRAQDKLEFVKEDGEKG